ncbi:MAG: hypothetical protein QOF62_3027 [Pyrinomonadaceae bacterium]|jgi:hypothetical protein|nr:hypothetical protein [Pyrinomonadaceae bacterium]HBB87530.1 hypothetical protein [Blastocatellia bacterium]
MKKEFAKLSKREQETAELKYHRTKPEVFDKLMTEAKAHRPDAIHLPSPLVETLKTVAENEGEPEYKTMVKRWVEERLRHETKLVRKSAKQSHPKKTALRRQA